MLITRTTSKGQLVPLIFGQDAVAASQTDVQLPIPISEASQAIDGYPMPFDGEIAGVSVRTTAAATAGTLTAGATINGTEDADTTVTVTTQTVRSKTVGRGRATFSAGAVIGGEITTNSGWDATSADLVVIVWVLLYLEGI